MKKIRNLLLSFTAVSALSLSFINTISVKAATKEEVIAAAQAAGIPQSQLQDGINMLESSAYTSEQYDRMLDKINEYKKNFEEGVENGLGGGSGSVTPEQPAVTTTASQTPQPSESGNVSAGANDFSSMTDEEKKEYIAGMSQAEKNEIIKNLDKDKQMEIINSLIDAGSEFGMNITLDGFTDDTLTYSVRNDDGQIVDISSVGVIVDDTGIDYTKFILIAAAVIVMSSAGIAVFAAIQKKQQMRTTEGTTDNNE